MSHSYEATQPRMALDADAVRAAYRRWAGIYDSGFGLVSASARREAIAAVNAAPGTRVLEVGVGTGLALPHYNLSKRITGIDLSKEMLARARQRSAELGLSNIDELSEMDAENTSFETGSFDIAVAMFVASVVPHPLRLVAELRRVVRPGGTILFINHFAAERGPKWWLERGLAPASRALGWHPDFRIGQLLPGDLSKLCTIRQLRPMGLFSLVRLNVT
ncbi:MAG: SAM-dependent methyltransferase [Rhodospirillales bacterium 20-60-12]|nr:MAG: SAM-dependent methyltransferase [Rhodospirillales bacterium 20-60-12]HQT66336.1 class I SAM-dependent methyltransferase [Acetobacteraceae bacterium]